MLNTLQRKMRPVAALAGDNVGILANAANSLAATAAAPWRGYPSDVQEWICAECESDLMSYLFDPFNTSAQTAAANSQVAGINAGYGQLASLYGQAQGQLAGTYGQAVAPDKPFP